MSFVPVLNNLKTSLETNADLQAFCQSTWGKSLTAKKAFKQRVEVLISELPIILITRPTRKTEDGLVRRKDNEHTVRLYAGFHQPNRETALDNLIYFEEYIDAAVMADPERGGTAASTEFVSSQNDEGLFHPVYFTVIELNIQQRA